MHVFVSLILEFQPNLGPNYIIIFDHFLHYNINMLNMNKVIMMISSYNMHVGYTFENCKFERIYTRNVFKQIKIKLGIKLN